MRGSTCIKAPACSCEPSCIAPQYRLYVVFPMITRWKFAQARCCCNVSGGRVTSGGRDGSIQQYWRRPPLPQPAATPSGGALQARPDAAPQRPLPAQSHPDRQQANPAGQEQRQQRPGGVGFGASQPDWRPRPPAGVPGLVARYSERPPPGEKGLVASYVERPPGITAPTHDAELPLPDGGTERLVAGWQVTIVLPSLAQLPCCFLSIAVRGRLPLQRRHYRVKGQLQCRCCQVAKQALRSAAWHPSAPKPHSRSQLLTVCGCHPRSQRTL